MMKRIAWLLFLPLLLTGCGYRVGSLMHPQVKTIAVANVINETTAYNVSVQLQQLLAEQYMLDGSLKVVDQSRADCIVYAQITNVAFRELVSASDTYDDAVYRPKIWQVQATVTFSVIVPSNRDPLIPQRRVIGKTEFQVQADMETNRSRATMMALRDAAKQIVEQTTEAW